MPVLRIHTSGKNFVDIGGRYTLSQSKWVDPQKTMVSYLSSRCLRDLEPAPTWPRTCRVDIVNWALEHRDVGPLAVGSC